MSTVFDGDQAHYRNNILNRNFLSALETRGVDAVCAPESTGDIAFFRINGITDFWKLEDKLNFDSIMGDIVNGLSKYNETFSYLIVSGIVELAVYVGISKRQAGALYSSICSSYPHCDLTAIPELLDLPICDHGGLLTGYPTNKTYGESVTFQIEKICKGLSGQPWVYLVLAKSLSPAVISYTHDKLLSELNQISNFIKRSVTGGPLGNQTIELIDHNSQSYYDNVKKLTERVHIGTYRGMWRTCVYYGSPDSDVADKLKNLLKGVYSGDNSNPEPIRCIPFKRIDDVIQCLSLISDINEESTFHPAGKWEVEGLASPMECFKYKFQTVLTSDDLATLSQIPRKELPGYYVDNFVEFEVAKRRDALGATQLAIGEIVTGSRADPGKLAGKLNPYAISLDDLTRHGLIIGITGGGKTNTSKSLLRELWVTHRKPFMVIESAKREYWDLFNLDGFQDMMLFTLGSEQKDRAIPYRINPFQVIGESSLQTHIDYLLSTFKASFELYPPMPYVLETCVYEVYADRGWDVLNNENLYGRSDYPSLTDLYHKVDIVTDRLGYHGEIQANVKAALKARINSLRIGGKGAMLDSFTSVPIETILNKPVVMELEDIGDDDVKAFVIGILLVQLYEYRKSQLQFASKQLEHVLVVEEAHRLLSNVVQGGEGGNPRAKAVEFFCNLLAEIRSCGQGILIADQIPTKLAGDAIKNTNLKITHRTVMQEDRETMGRSMNMTSEQIEYLSSLKRGYAAVYAEGDTRPKLVKMPLVESKTRCSRTQALANIRAGVNKIVGSYSASHRHNVACSICLNRCQSRQIIEDWLKTRKITTEELKTFAATLDEYAFTPSWIKASLKHFQKKFHTGVLSDDLSLCLIGEFLKYSEIEESYKHEKIILFVKERSGSGVE